MENVVYLHNGVLFSDYKIEIIRLEGNQMDLEVIILNEVSQTQKDKLEDLPLERFTRNCRKVTNVAVGMGWVSLSCSLVAVLVWAL